MDQWDKADWVTYPDIRAPVSNENPWDGARTDIESESDGSPWIVVSSYWIGNRSQDYVPGVVYRCDSDCRTGNVTSYTGGSELIDPSSVVVTSSGEV
jgi:hypothetical protein